MQDQKQDYTDVMQESRARLYTSRATLYMQYQEQATIKIRNTTVTDTHARVHVDVHIIVRTLCTVYTVFTPIVAAATIDFSPTRAWLLIEGGYYLRTALINFGKYWYTH